MLGKSNCKTELAEEGKEDVEEKREPRVECARLISDTVNDGIDASATNKFLRINSLLRQAA